LSRDTENIRLTPIEAEFQRQAALLQAAKLARQPFPADAIQRSPQSNRNPSQHEQPPPQDNTDDASEPEREQHEQQHQQDDPQPGPSHQNNQQDPPHPHVDIIQIIIVGKKTTLLLLFIRTLFILLMRHIRQLVMQIPLWIKSLFQF